MPNKLYYNTVEPLLLSILKTLMSAKEFSAFRLVGGTALSLYLGHRKSIDIDLFTDAPYGKIDFNAIDTFLKKTYAYIETNEYDVIGFGKSYFIGNSEKESIKLDLFYTDEFIEPALVIDHIRLA
ncbi:MAG TPA: nucleotidyl transferase AbiEii/AbiGii toxin family protein, partial [Bacteroidia bacterium]|nr:nucleotidyl transferase AbiEii/AbiGii toxin family protein [Bacteroidia bacterium]